MCAGTAAGIVQKPPILSFEAAAPTVHDLRHAKCLQHAFPFEEPDMPRLGPKAKKKPQKS